VAGTVAGAAVAGGADGPRNKAIAAMAPTTSVNTVIATAFMWRGRRGLGNAATWSTLAAASRALGAAFGADLAGVGAALTLDAGTGAGVLRLGVVRWVFARGNTTVSSLGLGGSAGAAISLATVGGCVCFFSVGAVLLGATLMVAEPSAVAVFVEVVFAAAAVLTAFAVLAAVLGS
jgi:hypothetical protein